MRGDRLTQKKRHHYVPEAYLRAFCDARGRVKVHPKHEGAEPYFTSPNGTGVRRYYYSQPTPEGGTDNNRLEDFFSTLEGRWPPLVKRMEGRENVNSDLSIIFEFAALQRVRVPASRDATEMKLARSVKRDLLALHAAGRLPPIPAQIGSLDDVDVAIDPNQSIHGMVTDIRGPVSQVFSRIGLCLVHNDTPRPFLTSDNPVIWFDPSVSDDEQRPYDVAPDGPILFLFPISPTMLLMGTDGHKSAFSVEGLLHVDAPNEEWVLRTNEAICRYGHEVIYASASTQEDVIKRYVDTSPVSDSGDGSHMIFGRLSKLPIWK